MTRLVTLRSQLGHTFGQLLADARGTTAVEYGLMAALISLAILSVVVGMGNGIKTTLYGSIVSGLQNMGNK